jgi:hypothetical protein
LRTAASDDSAAEDVANGGMVVTYLVEEGNHHTSVSDGAIYQELGIHAQSRLLWRRLGKRKNRKINCV